MAVILPNISASLSSFKVNSQSKALQKLSGTYGTADILNGGETLDNELEYVFSISGLEQHTIGVIYTKSLLLDSNGELIGPRKLSFNVNGQAYSGTINASDSVKTLITTPFVINEQVDGKYDITIKVSSNDIESCYYGLHSVLIELSDIAYSVQLRFTGPKTYRTAGNITVSAIVVNRGSLEVSFSKDPTTDYNQDIHNVEGRIYFLHDGIYIDGYKHSYNLPASSNQYGVVKLKDAFDVDVNGQIIPPTESGIASSPQLVYTSTQQATDKIRGTVYIKDGFDTNSETGEEIAPTDSNTAASTKLVYNKTQQATDQTRGTVYIRDSFETDEETGAIIAPEGSGIAVSVKLLYDALNNLDQATEQIPGVVKLSGPSFDIDPQTGGVIAPEDSGVAASIQLVYNTMASLKNYVDENKIDIYIDEDNNSLTPIRNELIFSKDFVLKDHRLEMQFVNVYNN